MVLNSGTYVGSIDFFLKKFFPSACQAVGRCSQKGENDLISECNQEESRALSRGIFAVMFEYLHPAIPEDNQSCFFQLQIPSFNCLFSLIYFELSFSHLDQKSSSLYITFQKHKCLVPSKENTNMMLICKLVEKLYTTCNVWVMENKLVQNHRNCKLERTLEVLSSKFFILLSRSIVANVFAEHKA